MTKTGLRTTCIGVNIFCISPSRLYHSFRLKVHNFVIHTFLGYLFLEQDEKMGGEIQVFSDQLHWDLDEL